MLGQMTYTDPFSITTNDALTLTHVSDWPDNYNWTTAPTSTRASPLRLHGSLAATVDVRPMCPIHLKDHTPLDFYMLIFV